MKRFAPVIAIGLALIAATASALTPLGALWIAHTPSTAQIVTVMGDTGGAGGTSRMAFVDIGMLWSDFETAKNTYEGTTEVDTVKAALPAGTKYKIDVYTGIFAPFWLAADGVPMINTVWGNGLPTGGIWPAFCATVSYPVFWDTAKYLPDLQAMITHLASLYASDPNLIEVKDTGLASLTDEQFVTTNSVVQNITNGVTNCNTLNDMSELATAGYTQRVAETAFKTISGYWAAAFPNIPVSAQFIAQGFPAITPGNPDAAPTVKEANIQGSGIGTVNLGPMETILAADGASVVNRWKYQNNSLNVGGPFVRGSSGTLNEYQSGGAMGTNMLGGVSLMFTGLGGVAPEYEFNTSDLYTGVTNPGGNNDKAINLLVGLAPQVHSGGNP